MHTIHPSRALALAPLAGIAISAVIYRAMTRRRQTGRNERETTR